MSINWKELELILSELKLKDSYIQKITEHNYHSLTLHLFHKEEKAWLFYAELSTPYSRVCRTGHLREKSKNTQRFTQYLRAHLIGRRITAVQQLPFDRAFILTLENSEDVIKMIFRLYSGSGANIIVTNSDNKILSILFRRPKRGEIEGELLTLPIRENEGSRAYSVRDYDHSLSFNEFIDKSENASDESERREGLKQKIIEKRDKELALLDESIRRLKERTESTKGYGEIERVADLLSASIYLVKRGMTKIELKNWSDDSLVVVPLDPALSPSENLDKLYTRYKKDKKTHTLATEELERVKKEREDRAKHYEALLNEELTLGKLKREALKGNEAESHLKEGRPGLYINSFGFTLIVGRNARENDEILRSSVRGSDMWMHTRDYAGGYVIIKSQRDKTIPLDVLIDAANLSLFFSKGRRNGEADLYYTEVKYLKRAKGAKLGLVLPTQERNFRVRLDEERIKRLLGSNEQKTFS